MSSVCLPDFESSRSRDLCKRKRRSEFFSGKIIEYLTQYFNGKARPSASNIDSVFIERQAYAGLDLSTSGSMVYGSNVF